MTSAVSASSFGSPLSDPPTWPSAPLVTSRSASRESEPRISGYGFCERGRVDDAFEPRLRLDPRTGRADGVTAQVCPQNSLGQPFSRLRVEAVLNFQPGTLREIHHQRFTGLIPGSG